jgi:hypothetical protein
MPDYSLGRAHGKIEIDYDGSGANKASRDLDSVTQSSAAADKSLTKTQRTVRDTERGMKSAGTEAEGYSARLKDVESASNDVTSAENRLKATLLDTRASLDDINDATDDLTEKRKRHAQAIDAERAAHKALSDGMNVGQRAASLFAGLIPNLNSGLDRLSTVTAEAGQQSSGLASKISSVAKVVAFLGPQGRAASAGLTLLANGMDEVGSSASSGSGLVSGFVKNIAAFEVEFGKIAGLSLALPSVGGLAGLGGAASIQGIVGVADAIRDLSGALGLLPSIISGVGFSMSTLQLAFRGVGDALTNMMADDPKAFLESIKNMGPAAAQSMLQIAGFRDQFKLAGGAVQDSFFRQIADDIAPLIQTWLPAVTAGMSQVAGVFGQLASYFAKLLMQPAATGAFQQFVDNLSAGLAALQPAIAPLLEIFTQLTVVGSSVFQEIAGHISHVLTFFAQLVDQAAASGELRQWIVTAVNGFGHLINIMYSVTSAFNTIMNVAEQFGGGGMLAWLEQLAEQLNQWTKSAEGQNALAEFFSAVRQATEAFTPMLGPLVQGIASIATAFTQLGIATAPGWQTFFDTFAATMAALAPQIVGMGPAINTFLTGLSQSFANLVATLGPQLPRIFQDLANAFVALLPQIPALAVVFVQLVEGVGPQLPKFFGAITDLIIALLPYVPTLIGFVRNLVSVMTWFIERGTGVVNWFTNFSKGVQDFVGKIPGALTKITDAITNFFDRLPDIALNAGRSMIRSLIEGITDNALTRGLGDAAKRVVDEVSSWFPQSPAKQGPFSGSGYTYVRGQKIVTDMAAGMASAQPSIEAAAAQTAQTASGALANATGGAPSPTGSSTTGSALLPDNIAGASTDILTAYLRHEFSDNRGLKGLAKDFGAILDVAKSGADLITQNVMQPLFEGLGMLPGAKTQAWRKKDPAEIAAEQQQELQRKALEGSGTTDEGPSWQDVVGPSAAAAPTGGGQVPLDVTASSSKTDIQKAIIAAGKARNMNEAQIQTALAVAAAESGFDPTISGGVQGSAGLVSGLYQQSPSSGWGTLEQVNDPAYAINAFYDAYAKQLEKNPNDPQLAAVLTQNPQLGSAAKGSDYWGAVSNQLGLADSILSQVGPDVKSTPGWDAVLGTPPASPASGTPPPTSTQQSTGTYGLPAGTDTGGYGTGNADTFPAWVMELANRFGVLPSTYAEHQETDRHEPGYAPNPQGLNRGIDWSGSVENMQALADYLKTIPGALEQVIWRNPNTGDVVEIAGGKPASGYYGEGTLAGHENHVHTRQSAPVPLPGGGLGASVGLPLGPTPQSAQPGVGAAAGAGTGLTLPSGKSIDELLDTTKQNVSVNDQLLQSYLQGNPALAQQINAAQLPGAGDDTVMGTLTDISKTIDGLKAQDAVGNKNTIDALQSTQSNIAQQQGFTQGPNQLQQAQTIASNAAGAIGGVFKAAQSGLDALAATQDIADRLVYGVRNTEDISKIVDNVQKYITFAADVLAAAGSIVSLAGSMTGGSDFGGTSAAGQALSLISSVLQGVNAAIDFGQQVYELTMGYVGKFMSVLTGLGGSDLMGNVGFLLNKNTGQLISYSHDNPEAKNTHEVPSWMRSWYDYNGQGNPNPQQNTQLNIFAGPGQSPGQMMNESMWMVNTGGTTGALAPANF